MGSIILPYFLPVQEYDFVLVVVDSIGETLLNIPFTMTYVNTVEVNAISTAPLRGSVAIINVWCKCQS